MLKVKVARDKVLHSVTIYATNDMGLEPEINSDPELIEWLTAVADDIGEIADIDEMWAEVDGDYVIIGGDKSVIEFVQSHITY